MDVDSHLAFVNSLKRIIDLLFGVVIYDDAFGLTKLPKKVVTLEQLSIGELLWHTNHVK